MTNLHRFAIRCHTSSAHDIICTELNDFRDVSLPDWWLLCKYRSLICLIKYKYPPSDTQLWT